jgi:hypothetical protein
MYYRVCMSQPQYYSSYDGVYVLQGMYESTTVLLCSYDGVYVLQGMYESTTVLLCSYDGVYVLQGINKKKNACQNCMQIILNWHLPSMS